MKFAHYYVPSIIISKDVWSKRYIQHNQTVTRKHPSQEIHQHVYSLDLDHWEKPTGRSFLDTKTAEMPNTAPIARPRKRSCNWRALSTCIRSARSFSVRPTMTVCQGSGNARNSIQIECLSLFLQITATSTIRYSGYILIQYEMIQGPGQHFLPSMPVPYQNVPTCSHVHTGRKPY